MGIKKSSFILKRYKNSLAINKKGQADITFILFTYSPTPHFGLLQHRIIHTPPTFAPLRPISNNHHHITFISPYINLRFTTETTTALATHHLSTILQHPYKSLKTQISTFISHTCLQASQKLTIK